MAWPAWRAVRNPVRYGGPNGETRGHLSYAYACGWAHPDLLGTALVAKAPGS